MKTSELTGAALDWAVARALGKRPSLYIYERTGRLAPQHNYSTDWAQGGPIIEREKIGIGHDADMGWIGIESDGKYETGPTPLIAAMRCYVASTLGDNIDIPEELT